MAFFKDHFSFASARNRLSIFVENAVKKINKNRQNVATVKVGHFCLTVKRRLKKNSSYIIIELFLSGK